MLAKKSVGFAVEIAADGRHLDDARDIERLGYAALWVNGGQLDTLDRLTELLSATESVVVAPAVVVPDAFDPGAVGQLFKQAEASAPGRLLIGLGSSHKAGSIAKLGGYVDRLDDSSVPRERRVLAAFGPRKLEFARERFAGAVPMMFTPSYSVARRLVGPDAMLAVGQYVVLDTDPAAARESARVPMRMLFSLPSYIHSARRQGFDDSDIESLSDRLVDAFVAWGSPEQIARRVRQHHDAGADHVYLTALHSAIQPGPREAERLLAPHVLRETEPRV